MCSTYGMIHCLYPHYPLPETHPHYPICYPCTTGMRLAIIHIIHLYSTHPPPTTNTIHLYPHILHPHITSMQPAIHIHLIHHYNSTSSTTHVSASIYIHIRQFNTSTHHWYVFRHHAAWMRQSTPVLEAAMRELLPLWLGGGIHLVDELLLLLLGDEVWDVVGRGWSLWE